MIEIKPEIPPEIKYMLAGTEREIELLINRNHNPIKKASLSVFKAGGKRLRPLLVLLSGYPAEDMKNLSLAAASVELLHIGSLVHDDVVDEASLRRGRKTVHKIFDELTAVSTGDNLFAMAFWAISKCGNQNALKLLTKAAKCMSDGQIMELEFKKQNMVNVHEYLNMVCNKTAILFESSCGIGSSISGSGKIEYLMDYGKNLGMAFQLVDDLIDLDGDSETVGKTIGNDLRQKTMTLPVIFALEAGLSTVVLEQIDKRSSNEKVSHVIGLIKETKAIEKVIQMIDNYTSKAGEAARAADCEMSQLLIDIVEYLAKRIN